MSAGSVILQQGTKIKECLDFRRRKTEFLHGNFIQILFTFLDCKHTHAPSEDVLVFMLDCSAKRISQEFGNCTVKELMQSVKHLGLWKLTQEELELNLKKTVKDETEGCVFKFIGHFSSMQLSGFNIIVCQTADSLELLILCTLGFSNLCVAQNFSWCQCGSHASSTFVIALFPW